MTGEFSVPLHEPQPSQLYLNGRKLALATEWFDFDEPNYDPIPVVEMGDDLVLTDGHTRTFLAWVAGAEQLRVRRETDDLDLATYRQCVEWCKEEGITEIGDLAGRAVNADTFVEVWVRRCEDVGEE